MKVGNVSARDGGICWSPKWNVRKPGDCRQPDGLAFRLARPPNFVSDFVGQAKKLLTSNFQLPTSRLFLHPYGERF